MYKFTLAIAAIAAAGIASAGSLPSELSAIGEPSQVLNVTFSNSKGHVEVYPGQTLSKIQTTNRPQPNLTESGSIIQHNEKYVFMMVDPDINTTNPFSVGLHTIISDFSTSNSSQHVWAEYVAPEPQGSSPHNYTLLLFKQPNNFTIPSHYDSWLPLNMSDVYTRLNFPLQSFLNQTGLDKPLAANWFREGASAEATTTSSGIATPTGSATQTATSSSVASLESVGGQTVLALLSMWGAVFMGM